MSIWLADVNGKVVKAIVNKSFPEFLKRVSCFLLIITIYIEDVRPSY